MANNIKIKICGQNNPAIINHCLDLNISYQGLIFYEKSPRFIDIETLVLVNLYFKTHKDISLYMKLGPTPKDASNLGATGARMVATLLNELHLDNKKVQTVT